MTILERLPSPHPSLPARPPPPVCNGSSVNGSLYQPSARIPSRVPASGSSSPLSYSNSKPPPPAPDPPSLDSRPSSQTRMPPASPNSVLAAAESQWLFTEEELLRTPSILGGMAPEQERENRSKGVNFITQVGIMLKLPQLTLATASVYLHRFYMRYSMVERDGKPGYHYYVCATHPTGLDIC
jgi:Cyclin, N-terminal domain